MESVFWNMSCFKALYAGPGFINMHEADAALERAFLRQINETLRLRCLSITSLLAGSSMILHCKRLNVECQAMVAVVADLGDQSNQWLDHVRVLLEWAQTIFIFICQA